MSEFFDDDNYNDGFNEDSYEQGMDLGLWKQLASLHAELSEGRLDFGDLRCLYRRCRYRVSPDHSLGD